MKQRKLIVVRSAILDSQRRNRWWKKHRKDAPLLFAKSLAAAYGELEVGAGVGSLVTSTSVEGVHRYLISATGHWVYYVLRESPAAHLVVLGFQGPGEADHPNLTCALRES